MHNLIGFHNLGNILFYNIVKKCVRDKRRAAFVSKSQRANQDVAFTFFLSLFPYFGRYFILLVNIKNTNTSQFNEVIVFTVVRSANFRDSQVHENCSLAFYQNHQNGRRVHVTSIFTIWQHCAQFYDFAKII